MRSAPTSTISVWRPPHLPDAQVSRAEVGLYDQSQLNRHFKRIVGLTPGQYARAVCRPGATTRKLLEVLATP